MRITALSYPKRFISGQDKASLGDLKEEIYYMKVQKGRDGHE